MRDVDLRVREIYLFGPYTPMTITVTCVERKAVALVVCWTHIWVVDPILIVASLFAPSQSGQFLLKQMNSRASINYAERVPCLQV